MAEFTLTRITRYDRYDLWSADVANISGDFQHSFVFPDDTEPLALCVLGFAVELIANMPDYSQDGIAWTGRVNDSNYKLWRRSSPFIRKTLVNAITSDIELAYPVEIRKGENILVQATEVDNGGTPTGDATITIMTRPTWGTLARQLITKSTTL